MVRLEDAVLVFLSTGRGVLTGLTEVSDVCGFDVVNGRKISC